MTMKRCRNGKCSFNHLGHCKVIPNSKYFHCKQSGDEIVDI